jgi:hypothetical protein
MISELVPAGIGGTVFAQLVRLYQAPLPFSNGAI